MVSRCRFCILCSQSGRICRLLYLIQLLYEGKMSRRSLCHLLQGWLVRLAWIHQLCFVNDLHEEPLDFFVAIRGSVNDHAQVEGAIYAYGFWEGALTHVLCRCDFIAVVLS